MYKGNVATSQLSLMKTLYQTQNNSGKVRKKSSKCVATVFLKSLQHLIKSINSTKPHFIRCIKPNHYNKPGIWEKDLISQQLKNSGIFAYLELRRFGYDVQIPFKSFILKIYYALRDDKDRKLINKSIDENRKWLKIAKLLKPMLIKLYDINDRDIQFGKTMIFMQNNNYRKLEFAATF